MPKQINEKIIFALSFSKILPLRYGKYFPKLSRPDISHKTYLNAFSDSGWNFTMPLPYLIRIGGRLYSGLETALRT